MTGKYRDDFIDAWLSVPQSPEFYKLISVLIRLGLANELENKFRTIYGQDVYK